VSASVTAVAARPRGRWKLRRYGAGYLFIAPIVIFFLAFVAYPLGRSIYLSLTQWSGFGTPHFVGLRNFHNLLHDSVFWTAMRVTVIFTAVTTLLQTVLPLLLAVLLNAGWRGSVLLRTLFFLPTVVSLVVTAVLWQLIYDPNFGFLNRVLEGVGLGGHAWLADPHTVVGAIIVVSLWQSFGFFMLLLYAGLQGIDPTLFDAARVDGASRLQELRYVTVPQLAPVLGVVITVNVINGLKTFDLIYVMTGGGPNHSSEVLGTYLYSIAFGSQAGGTPALGYATAISMIVFVLSMLAVVIQFRISARRRRGLA
jgi:ABC-type sugar transport system permease subunit